MIIQQINGFRTAHTPYTMTKPQKFAFNQIAFKGDTFDYDSVVQKELDKRSGWDKFWGTGKKAARNRATQQLIGFNLAQDRIIQAKNSVIEGQKKAMEEAHKALALAEQNTQLVKDNLEKAKQDNVKDSVIENLQKKLKDLESMEAAKKQNYETQKSKFDKIKEEQEILTKREANKGWNKVAGYEIHKTRLEEAFINKIAAEKAGLDVNIPNGILFFGPSGTGKTHFAKAFAEQAGCEFVKIDMLQDDDDIIMDLKNQLEASKNRYNSPETPKKRTIILLDDFNSIAQVNTAEREELENGTADFSETNAGQLAKLLENCADEYKATIFMTTNYPRRIDSALLKSNLIPYQVYVGPPNDIDAAKIFEYYVKDFTEQDIDYNTIGEKAAKAMDNNEAYSVQGIINIVDSVKDNCSNSQITETDLLNAIDKVKPNINKKTFEQFIEDTNELLDTYYSNSKKEV